MSQVCVFGKVSTQALRELFAREVRVVYFSWGGWLSGIAHGMPHRNVELRLAQFTVARDADRSLELARAFVEAKIRNQRTLLRRNAREDIAASIRELERLARRAPRAPNPETLLGLEGAAAKVYFSRFSTILARAGSLPGDAFSFSRRSRRPPRDAVNALLSFVYALLVKDCLASALAVGFDPYLGFFHHPRHGRPALALDVAEEFRPIVADSVAIGVINNGEVRPSDFIVGRARWADAGWSPDRYPGVREAPRHLDSAPTLRLLDLIQTRHRGPVPTAGPFSRWRDLVVHTVPHPMTTSTRRSRYLVAYDISEPSPDRAIGLGG